MSSEAPEKSPLEQAKLEANELYLKLRRDLDSLRTAPLNEFGNRIDSLQEAVKLSQESASISIDKSLKTCDERIDALENSLQAKEKKLKCVKGRLLSKQERISSLEKQLSVITAERDDAKAKHDQVEAENDKAQLELKRMSSGLKEAEVGLKEAQRCVTHAQNQIGLLKQRNIDPQEGLSAVEQAGEDLSNEPVAVRKHEAGLQADTEGANQRAPSTNAKPDTLQSGLNRINKSTIDDDSSITEQPTPSQLASTSAACITRQDSSKETTEGVEMAGDQQQPHELLSQPAQNHNMGETDRNFCEKVLRTVMDDKRSENEVQFFLASSGLAQPLNLTVIDEKLRQGVYTSVNSFRKDFESMIERYRTILSPHSMLGIASYRLRMFFDETWFALESSRSIHQFSATQDRGTDNSSSRGHKRKASTERPVMSEDNAEPRRAPGPSHPTKSSPRATSPGTGGDLSPALTQSEKAHLTSEQRPETGSDIWRGEVAVAPYFGFGSPVSFHAVGNLVSVVKSPRTFNGSWTRFIPAELDVQSRSMINRVDQYLDGVRGEFAEDTLILRLAPSSESEHRNFNLLCRDLNARQRYAQVRHSSVGRKNGGQVQALYLVPVSRPGRYPNCLYGLDQELLPTPGNVKELFLVVSFLIAPSEEEQLQKAWDQLIKALCTAERHKTIADARDRIVHHSILLQRRGAWSIFVDKEYMNLLNELPLIQSHSTLARGFGEFLSLSYSRPIQIENMKLPSLVFILGRLMRWKEIRSLVVVDLKHPSRPLWEIRKGTASGHIVDSMRLLRSELPRSLQKWLLESMIPQDTSVESWMTVEYLGLKIERYGPSD